MEKQKFPPPTYKARRVPNTIAEVGKRGANVQTNFVRLLRKEATTVSRKRLLKGRSP
jgi:hypothetical protein